MTVAAFKSPKRDRFRNFPYVLGSIFCITPWYDFKKNKLKKPPLNKLHSVLTGIAVTALSVIAIKQFPYDEDENIFEKLLCITNSVISIFFIQSLIFGSTFIKQRKWKAFLKKFFELQVLRENCLECTTAAPFYLHFLLGHLFFIVSFTCYGFAWFSNVGLKLIIPFMYGLTLGYYCFLYVLVSSNFVLIALCMYTDLNKLLENAAESYSLKLCEGLLQEELFVNRLLDVGKRYRSLADFVDYYNDIFGWPTVLIFLNSIIQLVRCANMTLRIMDRPEMSWTVFISLICGLILSMGESLYIIICCHLASSTGQKMKRLCHRLQENFGVASRSRMELFNLADIVESYKPEFTAADFFVIRKGTILGIISIATTYLIVVIQFNSKLHEKLKDKE